MTQLNEQPLNLQQMLSDFQAGIGHLPTYNELVQIDVQIGCLQAQVASLRQLVRTILHEQAAAAYIKRLP